MLKIGEFFIIRELYQKGWTQTAIAKKKVLIGKPFISISRRTSFQSAKPTRKRMKEKLHPYKN